MVKKCSEKTEGRPQAVSRSVSVSVLCAEVRRTHRVVAQQLLAAAGQRDAAGLEHVADVGDLAFGSAFPRFHWRGRWYR